MLLQPLSRLRVSTRELALIALPVLLGLYTALENWQFLSTYSATFGPVLSINQFRGLLQSGAFMSILVLFSKTRHAGLDRSRWSFMDRRLAVTYVGMAILEAARYFISAHGATGSPIHAQMLSSPVNVLNVILSALFNTIAVAFYIAILRDFCRPWVRYLLVAVAMYLLPGSDPPMKFIFYYSAWCFRAWLIDRFGHFPLTYVSVLLDYVIV